MLNQVLQFYGTYYQYKEVDNIDPSLSIGRFDSAYCSDLVVIMPFDKVEKKLFSRVKILTKKRKQVPKLNLQQDLQE